MSGGKDESSKEGVFENHGGLILGCWDHEKTATLIQDLEHSVNLVERKCIQLFEELIYYKKYLEESRKEDLHLTVCKGKARKSKNSNFCSGSEPDIAFRKNLINFQEVQQVFEEKFKAKLWCINKELGEAARKIGLRDNIILSRPGDHDRGEDEAEKCCGHSGESLITFFNGTTKSDPVIIEHGEEEEFSKITRDELEIYQKLSRLSMIKRKKKKKSKGRKMKFRFKRKCPRCRQDVRSRKAESNKSKFGKRERENGVSVLHTRSHSPCDSSSKVNSQEKLNKSELKEMCKSLKESPGARNVRRSGEGGAGREAAAEGSLGAAIRKAVPFTACTSTSRSHNVGLNLQQLLSLSKHRKSFASEKRTQNSEFGEVKSSNKISSDNVEKEQVIPRTPNTRNSGFENFEVGGQERKRKVSTPSHGMSSTSRKVRSKYTGSSPEEVSQSTTRENAKSTMKSVSTYGVGFRIQMSDRRRTDVFRIGEFDDCFENASGDGTCNGRRIEPSLEWTKAYGSFLSMCRKYSCLKEKLNDDRLVPADEELKSLESEIDYSIEKYKDFLQFYSKFLQLNHRLKWLKNACESTMSEPVATFTSDSHRKICSCGPAHSSNLKKALKEVQTLQEKIRLVNV